MLKKLDDSKTSLSPQKRSCPIQNLENGGIDTEPQFGSPAQGSRILEHTLNDMEMWIKDCIQNHIQCTRRKTMRKTMQYTERLPSRLLHMNPTQGNNFVTVQNTSDMDASTKYVTLSHCWYVVVSLDQVLRNSLCLQPIKLVLQASQNRIT